MYGLMHAVCQDIKACNGSLLCFTQRSRYDETPMRCKTSDERSLAFAAKHVGETLSVPNMVGSFQDSLRSKLCHSEFSVATLVKVPDGILPV